MTKKEIIQGLKEILKLMDSDLYALGGEVEIDMINSGDLKLDETQRAEALMTAIHRIDADLI